MNLVNPNILSDKFHLIDGEGSFILIPDGNRIYEINETLLNELTTAAKAEDSLLLDDFLIRNGLQTLGIIDDSPVLNPPLTSISLAIAQKCNLACSYCYAQQGEFGHRPRNMELETGIAAVDLMFSNNPGSNVMNIAFLGGEPLVNREALQQITRYASAKAVMEEKRVNFSITTNGTLLSLRDADFFEEFGYAVTVSLDGIGTVHDRLRPFKGGNGSYEKIVRNVKPLLEMQRQMQVSARVTVTPYNLQLLETLEELIGLGFHSVGFSPMLSSPSHTNEMDQLTLGAMLEKMISCGKKFENELIKGNRFPFSNMTIALREIHKGTHRPYPCGAGAGYLGVSAGGDLSACHRFVEDSSGYFGNLVDGIDKKLQQTWLRERHVHRQEPCNACWARYMCGGGCHHEVIKKGRPACDYIRGWLHYTLQAYTRLLSAKPEYFALDNVVGQIY